MSHLTLAPRWRKVLRDLELNQTRTALVVLSLAIGVFTVGLLIDADSMLRADFYREFAAVNPSSATLVIPEGFDEELVKSVRRMPEIREVGGRRTVTVRLQVGSDRWINLDLCGIDDFTDIRVDKVQPDLGVWPPAKGQLLIEKSSLNLADLRILNAGVKNLSLGQTVTVKTADGDERTLGLVGVAYDFNRTPSPGTGRAYGFVTLDTLERLGEPRAMNELRIIVAQNELDKEAIRSTADRVKAKVEKSGRTVSAISVPEPGEHPLQGALNALALILGALGALTLAGGAFLVLNTIVALLAQQVRQIGVMKAVGASGTQIAGMYLAVVALFGLLSLIIATPLAVFAGSQFARFLGGFFDLDVTRVQIPAQAFVVQGTIAFGVPLLAALYPILSGTRVSVQQALSDFGLAKTTAGLNRFDRLLGSLRGPLFRRPLLISLRNTFRRRARLVFTVLPLALSGAVFVSIANVRTALVSELDDIYAHKNYDVEVTFQRPYRNERIANAAASVPGVTLVEGYHRTIDAYRVRADDSRTSNLLVQGLTPATRMQSYTVIAGRWLQPADRDAIVVNDALLRDEADLGLGSRVRYRIQGHELDLTIVGVIREKMATATIYMTDSYFVNVFGEAGRAGSIWIRTDPRALPSDVVKLLEGQFRRSKLEVATAQTPGDKRQGIEFHFGIISIPLGLLAALLALIGSLGLMSTMTTQVMERRREIGILRAIGAADGSVQQIFVVEGIVIGVLSWALGVLASWPPTWLLGDQIGVQFLKVALPFTPSAAGILIWLVLVIVIAALSCYWPARNATQTSVRALLAYE